MYCPNCGVALNHVPVGEPCPQCGDTRRDATVVLQETAVGVEVPQLTIGIGYAEHRPWQQKWQDVEHGLERIESAYDVTQGQGQYGNEHVRRVVEGFFKDCRELADWLWQDHQSTNLDKPTVIAFVMADPDLRIADGLAQTIKHHTRTGTDPITAHITDITIGAEERNAKIGWSRPSGAKGSEDALDLARKCVDAWRRFLAGRGLKP
jgi:hypothetical protein